MTKIFPKSRICVIDIYPSFETGLKKAVDFAKTNHISINSSDGKKLIFGFCLKYIQDVCNNTDSKYPKVLCMSKKCINVRVEHFVNNYFNKMIKIFPVPYCGKYDLASPDLEFAAQNVLSCKPKQGPSINKLLSTFKYKVV